MKVKKINPILFQREIVHYFGTNSMKVASSRPSSVIKIIPGPSVPGLLYIHICCINEVLVLL